MGSFLTFTILRSVVLSHSAVLYVERFLLQKIEKKIMPATNIFAVPLEKKWHKICSKWSCNVCVLGWGGISREEKAEAEKERVLLL